jgi:hypothetical protein
MFNYGLNMLLMYINIYQQKSTKGFSMVFTEYYGTIAYWSAGSDVCIYSTNYSTSWSPRSWSDNLGPFEPMRSSQRGVCHLSVHFWNGQAGSHSWTIMLLGQIEFVNWLIIYLTSAWTKLENHVIWWPDALEKIEIKNSGVQLIFQ